MESTRRLVVQTEEYPYRLPRRPPAQRNHRGCIVSLQLKHLTIGQRNRQIPILNTIKQSYTEIVEEVERLVDATTSTSVCAVVVAEIAEEPLVRKPQARTNGKIIDVILVGIMRESLNAQGCPI